MKRKKKPFFFYIYKIKQKTRKIETQTYQTQAEEHYFEKQKEICNFKTHRNLVAGYPVFFSSRIYRPCCGFGLRLQDDTPSRIPLLERCVRKSDAAGPWFAASAVESCIFYRTMGVLLLVHEFIYFFNVLIVCAFFLHFFLSWKFLEGTILLRTWLLKDAWRKKCDVKNRILYIYKFKVSDVQTFLFLKWSEKA